MAVKRMVLEFGMGTDISGADPTKAALRALRDALLKVINGGLDVPDPEHDDAAVIASAAVAVRVDVSALATSGKRARPPERR